MHDFADACSGTMTSVVKLPETNSVRKQVVLCFISLGKYMLSAVLPSKPPPHTYLYPVQLSKVTSMTALAGNRLTYRLSDVGIALQPRWKLPHLRLPVPRLLSLLPR